MQRIEFSLMQQTIFHALQKAGLDEASARTCARIHTESSCDGISSHGLNRVARFVDYVNKGWIDIHAKPELEKSLVPSPSIMATAVSASPMPYLPLIKRQRWQRNTVSALSR